MAVRPYPPLRAEGASRRSPPGGESDLNPSGQPDQTQIPHIIDIIGRHVLQLDLTGKQWLDHLSHLFFPELIGQLIQMRFPPQDQVVFGVIHHDYRDRLAAILARGHLETSSNPPSGACQ